MPTPDDLEPWQDDPLVRALTGPAGADELAGEEQVLAAFRLRARRRRRAALRLGLSGTTLVVAFGLSGGVAAAYGSALPSPLQRAAHWVLGPIGVPGPPRPPTVTGGGSSPASSPVTSSPPPSRSTSPTPSTSTLLQPTPGATGTASTGSRPTAAPTTPPAAPVTEGTPTPTTSPQPTATAADPSTWQLVAAARRPRVPVHQGDRFTATLTDATGAPVVGHRLVAFERLAGAGTGWTRAAVRRTGSDGTVHFRLTGLTRTVFVVVRSGHGVHSAPLRIVVIPSITATTAPTADGTGYDVTVGTDGGDPGDTVALLRWRDGRWRVVRTATLDGQGGASFTVPKPANRTVRYVVRLRPTKQHGFAHTSFAVQPG